MNEIVLIGAGNVAWHLGHVLKEEGYHVAQVFSRTPKKANALAKRLKCKSTIHLGRIYSKADLYIIAVHDDAIPLVAQKIAPRIQNSLVVHTSGSYSSKILDPYFPRNGNFYPLQTFSTKRSIAFKGIPIFIQCLKKTDRTLLWKLAETLSGNVHDLKDQQKPNLHLAAVIANNFTNHLLGYAKEILDAENLPFESIVPLLEETIEKLKVMDAKKAQTGPAKRGDVHVLQKHLSLIQKEEFKYLYKKLSSSINPSLKKKL